MRTTKNSVRSSNPSSKAIKTSNPDTKSSTKNVPGARALKNISNRALLSGIKRLSKTERETVLSILVHLVEIDRRRLYVPLGFSSLYEFCQGHLGYSERTACRRVILARIIRDYPQCFKALASGRVSMTNLVMVSKIINPENADDILSRITGASKSDVKLLVSSRRPRSAIRESITPVHVKTVLQIPESDKKFTATGGGKNPSTSEVGDSGCISDSDIKGAGAGADGKGPAANLTGCGPLATVFVIEEMHKITFGADQAFIDKIDRLRALFSSKYHRDLELVELFSILMDEYIERHSPEGRLKRRGKREQKKTGQKKAELKKAQKDSKKTGKDTETYKAKNSKAKTSRAAKKEPSKVSRHIPQKVRDEVYARDNGCCTYRSAGGRKCGSTHDLQVDHIVPFARGGDNSPSNLRLLCGKHNRLEAERVYGKKHMEQYVKEPAGEYLKESRGLYLKGPMGQYLTDSAGRYMVEPAGQFLIEPIGLNEKKAPNTKPRLVLEHRPYYGAVVRSDMNRCCLN